MNGLPLLLVEALATRNDSGLGRLARMMVEGLRGLASEADIRVILPRSGTFRPGGHCRAIPADPRPFRLWAQTAFPLLIRRLRPRAVLCLGQTLPLWRPPARYALMVPDAGPLEDLGRRTSRHDAYNRRWLGTMPPKADRILTIGRFSKERLVRLLGLPPDRISIVRPIPGGIRPVHPSTAEPYQSAVPARAPAKAAPEGPYLLAVGNIEPRKNFPGLIEAYARLKAGHPSVPPLYIVGHKAWGFREAEEAAVRHRVAGSVVFTGFVSQDELEAFISGCAFFVSSSLYEGWGLPLFEALARGKPAIFHEGSSQEEFARGLALAVDCSRPELLAGAMERLWSDAEERARLEAALARDFPKVLQYDLEGALGEALRPLLSPP